MADPKVLALIDQITNLGSSYKSGDASARAQLLEASTKLQTNLMLPAEGLLWQQWAQPSHQSILRTAIEIHLFESMAFSDASPKPSATIAEKTEPRAETVLVARMLRHLASMGTIDEVAADTFVLTKISTAYTRPEVRDMVLFIVDDFQPVHENMPKYFRENVFRSPISGVDGPFQAAFGCKGEHMFEYFAKQAPMMGKRFASMMDVWSKDRPKWWQSNYYPVKERLISGGSGGKVEGGIFLVDVGGGSGHDIQEVLEGFSDVLPGKLILQDRPEILEVAKVDGSIEKMPHDFLTEQPVKGARAYYLHSIIQDWDDETNVQILKSLVPAMHPGHSKILINDFVVPNEGAHWGQTSLDWELMASLGARHRTRAEHTRVIEAAGLKIAGIWKHPLGLDSLVECELA